MNRSAATPGGLSMPRAALATGGLLALLCGLACFSLRPVAEAGPPQPWPKPVSLRAASPAASTRPVEPSPTPAAATVTGVYAATPHEGRAPTAHTGPPYRFVGWSASGAEAAIVLFGRGRVVNVIGPQALDDEYVVEAVFDDYLVIRHVPTGVGTFLALAQRQREVGPARDPEDSQRD